LNGWTALALLGALVALAVVYFRVIVPFNQLREALRRLAGRDFRPVLLDSRRGVFRETASSVQKISELLQQLDQQIADEGFSLRAILSSMVEGVFITDRAQRIRLVNEPLQRMLDLRQPAINRTVIEVFRNHQLQQAVEQTLFDGQTRRIETALEVAGPDGYSTRHLEVYAGGLNPGGKRRPLGAVVVFHDITKLKELEAVRREFVANVSHEFRTPLAIINGYVETLLEGALDDREMSEKFLGIMARNGQRLTMLIEDLLTISRMEHRSVPMEFHRLNVRDVLSRVVEQIESALAEKHAMVNIDWDESALEAEVDPGRLEQVFANLLENALRHGHSDRVEIRITGRRVGDDLEIVFSDNGPGIPLEDQPHIFERFYRVQKDRSRTSGGGTGLGLSIVKHIVLAHRGSVTVESRPGAGASFRVRIPIVHAGPSASGGATVLPK
jgi:two-component system phosphate regulon sensor histidine kinase PhoR